MRNVVQNHGPSPDARVFANPDISEDMRTSTDENAATNFGVTITALFTGTTKRDRMEHRHVIFDHGSLADNDGGRMIDHDAFADARTGMDIDAEHF